MKTFVILGIFVASLGVGNSAVAKNGPTNCYIQTYNGRYLTAVGGGGQLANALHSDATKAKSWEKFTLIDADKGTANITYGIRTMKGTYLTIVDGGGRISNVVHSDGTHLRDWEEVQLESLSGGWYAIKTFRGNYLTAVDGGGRITDVIHSDATRIGRWEKFRFTCGVK